MGDEAGTRRDNRVKVGLVEGQLVLLSCALFGFLVARVVEQSGEETVMFGETTYVSRDSGRGRSDRDAEAKYLASISG